MPFHALCRQQRFDCCTGHTGSFIYTQSVLPISAQHCAPLIIKKPLVEGLFLSRLLKSVSEAASASGAPPGQKSAK